MIRPTEPFRASSSSLPFHTLGRSATKVSALGLGCVTFGREVSEATAFEIMDYAFAHGITTFDTAEAYGGGQARAYRKQAFGSDDAREVSDELHSSEKIVGRWLQSRGTRAEITLITKTATAYTAASMAAAIAASLERLQTGYVDVYLLHRYGPGEALEAAVGAIDAIVRAGSARTGGCSNFTAAQLASAHAISRRHGWRRFEVIESSYNLVQREIERDLVRLLREETVGLIAYSPLAAGFLTGKYTPDRRALPPGSRFHIIPGHADVYFSERNFRLVARLHQFAASIGVDPLRLAMAWVFRQSVISTVLVGARTIDHLANALAARELVFLPEWVEEIDRWAESSAAP